MPEPLGLITCRAEGVVRTAPTAVDLAQVRMIHLGELVGQLVGREVEGTEEGEDREVGEKGEVEEKEVKEHTTWMTA